MEYQDLGLDFVQHNKTNDYFILIDQIGEKFVLINKDGKTVSLPEDLFEIVTDENIIPTEQQLNTLASIDTGKETFAKSSNSVLDEMVNADLVLFCKAMLRHSRINDYRIFKLNVMFLNFIIQNNKKTLSVKNLERLYEIYNYCAERGYSISKREFFEFIDKNKPFTKYKNELINWKKNNRILSDKETEFIDSIRDKHFVDMSDKQIEFFRSICAKALNSGFKINS